MRLVVLNDLAVHPRNAPWGLFATNETHRRTALAQYRPRSEVGTHLRNQMSYHILGEGNMAYTYEDMQREAREWLKGYLPQLDPEEPWLNKQRRDH